MIKLFVAAVLTAGVLIVPASVLAESNNSKDSESKSSSKNSNDRQDVDDEDDEDKKDSQKDSDDDSKKSNSKKTSDKTKDSNKSAVSADSKITVPTPKIAAGNAGMPGDVLDMTNWYLTLPTGVQGKPDTIQPAGLAKYSSDFMMLNDTHDGVVFTTNAGGNHTKNSKYPRSELREMIGGKNASWDGNKGTHTMEIKQAITKVPPKKPEVVVGQIHATSDDLMQIHLSGDKLTVTYDDGKKTAPLDESYQLGKIFDIRIESSAGHVRVWYDGQLKADLPISSPTSYFKAGNYLQTNPSKGDDAAATSEVVIYALTVHHQ